MDLKESVANDRFRNTNLWRNIWLFLQMHVAQQSQIGAGWTAVVDGLVEPIECLIDLAPIGVHRSRATGRSATNWSTSRY
jgi:hypothetical protein